MIDSILFTVVSQDRSMRVTSNMFSFNTWSKRQSIIELLDQKSCRGIIFEAPNISFQFMTWQWNWILFLWQHITSCFVLSAWSSSNDYSNRSCYLMCCSTCGGRFNANLHLMVQKLSPFLVLRACFSDWSVKIIG